MNSITSSSAADLKTISALAGQAVKRPESGPVEYKAAKAEQLYDALESVDQLCGRIVKENPQEAKEAKLLKEIAEEAMRFREKSGIKDYQKVGLFQGGLEVIAAVNGSLTPGVIAQAARNVLDGQGRLYLLDGHNREKQQDMFIMGAKGIKKLALSLSDQPALDAFYATRNDESALIAVGQMGELDLSAEKPVDVKLLGRIAEKTLEAEEGRIYSPPHTLEVMSGSLKVIRRLSQEVDHKHTIYPHLGFALGEIAENALQKNQLMKPVSFFHRRPESVLTPGQKIGNCQGALTVLSELSEGSSSLTVKHMAGSLLYAEERMHFSKGSQNREKNDQMYLSGRDALKIYAQGAEIKGTSMLDDLKTPEKVREYLNRKWNSWS